MVTTQSPQDVFPFCVDLTVKSDMLERKTRGRFRRLLRKVEALDSSRN